MAEAVLSAALDKVTLTIGGAVYDGWTDVEIRRGLDTLAGQFTVSMADRGASDAKPFPFEAGVACALNVGGDRLITGWIDQLVPSFSDSSHAITITGRDKAADLVDCSAIHKPGSWANVALEQIASELTAPFGITVTAKASTAPMVKKFAIQQGETVFAAIERLCKFRGLLPISTIDGNVELIAVQPGDAVERLAEGVNIKSASATHDVSSRHSLYIVKGQVQGDDFASGDTVTYIKGEAKDPAVTRYRPLIVMSEEQADHDGLVQRAKWEASTRAGRAQTAPITLVGWRTPAGKLRDRGMCFDVHAPKLFIDDKMMATEVVLRFGVNGTTTEITVAPPEAYSRFAIPETAKASKRQRKKPA
jgi:prophage tail gpP-like protein